MERKSLGVAVIGSGRIGALRAQLAAGHPGVNFLAVSDRVIKAAEQAQASVHVGYSRRYKERYLIAREQIV